MMYSTPHVSLQVLEIDDTDILAFSTSQMPFAAT